MTSNKRLPPGGNGEGLQRTRRECPAFITFLAVACTFFAGLGDWKVLNNAYGGLPKAFALGAIVCAFLSFLFAIDFADFLFDLEQSGASRNTE